MHTIKQHRALHAFANRIDRATPNCAGAFWIAYTIVGIIVALVVML